MLVAVVMLFVVGAMAALSIDVVTLYTARSEAQLVADAAALAGARVLANSGATSDTTGTLGLMALAEPLASAVAIQVAQNSMVGGRYLVAGNGEVVVSFSGTPTNPRVTVRTQRTDLPTFFARIWGSQQVTVAASATAEAYNPSGAVATSASSAPPVAPLCMKPWLLPNIDPTQAPPAVVPAIFDPATGAIVNSGLLGKSWPLAGGNPNGLSALCGGDCSPSGGGITAPAPGQYYPGAIDASDFPAPTQALPACSAGWVNTYQLAVAGCVQQPIVCGASSSINIDTTPYAFTNPGGRDADTVQAAECLIHYTVAGDSDSIDTLAAPSPPFQFLAGNQNPIASAIGKDVMVSDSLVTIPVINYPPGTPTNPVTVIGFLQVFLNPQSTTTLPVGPPGTYQIPATIINMAGCGNTATGNPILGNGASPVAVRLISAP